MTFTAYSVVNFRHMDSQGSYNPSGYAVSFQSSVPATAAERELAAECKRRAERLRIRVEIEVSKIFDRLAADQSE